MEKVNFKNLEIFFRKVVKIVDPKIKEILDLYVDKKTRKLVNYQIEVGGKRLRPALAVASCLVCGGEINDVLYPAAGLEILHNYTLIIDDIIDNSDLRRGKPTTWFKFGRSIAQCVGMGYSATIFQAANKSKNPIKTSELLAKALKAIVDGEILDILFEQSGREDEKYITANRYKKITQHDYFRMIDQKTVTLIQACCEIGGITAGAKKSEMATLKKYGFNLGIAFQIKDDILDIFGNEKKFGKKIGNDIKERKLGNIVIFYALRELPQPKRKKVLTILRKKEIKDKEIKEVIKLIKETKAKERAYLLGKDYTKKAKENLKFLPHNKWNEILNKIADFVIERNK
jgi:geranylgeranyl diphosphate synthase type I